MQALASGCIVLGSPAFAGIDLEHGAAIVTPAWFPRVRGDRPKLFINSPGGEVGSPAFAGIDPSSCASWRSQ